jgi:dienelactone hydrolase
MRTLLLAMAFLSYVGPPVTDEPQRVEIRSGPVTLGGLLWRPKGAGPFPAVLLNHGSGRTKEELARLGPYEEQAYRLGPVFARHGYLLLFLFRRGVGLSSGMGQSAVDLLTGEFRAHGDAGRNKLQLQLLDGREKTDAFAGLAWLRALPEADRRNIMLVGHSFGGSLTVFMAAEDAEVRAAVVFSGAGYSWDRSPELRARLLEAVTRARASFFFIHAANDFSLGSGQALDTRLAKTGKPHRLKIYPPTGQTAEEGHAFALSGVPIWESDVFSFMDSELQR